MEAESVSEMLEIHSVLTGLIVRYDFKCILKNVIYLISTQEESSKPKIQEIM
jgi:hypothetical protein